MKDKETIHDGALSAEQREAAKEKIKEIVNGWLPGLVDEAFYLADRDDSHVNWGNLHEVAEHVTGCLAMHAQGEILEEFEEFLADMQAGEAQD